VTQIHRGATAELLDALETWEVDPAAFEHGRGDNSSAAKWAVIAARLLTEKKVPCAVSATAVKKRAEKLEEDSKKWLVRIDACSCKSAASDTHRRQLSGIQTRSPQAMRTRRA
jgi:hypothetical protein